MIFRLNNSAGNIRFHIQTGKFVENNLAKRNKKSYGYNLLDIFFSSSGKYVDIGLRACDNLDLLTLELENKSGCFTSCDKVHTAQVHLVVVGFVAESYFNLVDNILLAPGKIHIVLMECHTDIVNT